MTSTLERPLPTNPEIPKKVVRFVGHELLPSEIEEAQVLRREYFEKKGLLTKEAIDENGRMIDHFADRSIWMGVRRPGEDEEKAVGRVIRTDGKDIDSLQMSLGAIKNPDEDIITHIRENSPAEIGEIASVMEFDDPYASLHLYATLAHASVKQGIKYWLFGLRQRSEPGFNKVLGPALHKLGDSVEIEGAPEELSPYLISIGDGIQAIRESLDDEGLDRFTRIARQGFIDAYDQYEAPLHSSAA